MGRYGSIRGVVFLSPAPHAAEDTGGRSLPVDRLWDPPGSAASDRGQCDRGNRRALVGAKESFVGGILI